MDHDIIIAVEAALAAKGVSVARLCRQADVSQTTWHRLKQGSTSGLRAGTLDRLRSAFVVLTGDEWPVPAKAA